MGQAWVASGTECPWTIPLFLSQVPTLPSMPMGSETCGAVLWTEGIRLHARAEVGCSVGMWARTSSKKLTSSLKAGTTAGEQRKGLNVMTRNFAIMLPWVSRMLSGWFPNELTRLAEQVARQLLTILRVVSMMACWAMEWYLSAAPVSHSRSTLVMFESQSLLVSSTCLVRIPVLEAESGGL